jgi:dTDP-4-dehydrorhamnose reductase
MRLLVTGAGGMLGREVVRAASEHEVVALTHAELDVTDGDAVSAIVEDCVVVNCAGFTDVDGAEADEDAATLLNGVAPGYLAAAARAIVHPSTDYVFDGTKREPYVESDPTGPRSAYGRSKLAGEQSVAAANPRHAIVRTSWLFGVGGRNFVDTMLGLAGDRDELRVVDDQVGCPTYVGHLARALVEFAESEAYGIHHVAGGGACSWFEFAREIFRQTELDVRVVPCTTDEFPRPAQRPAYSVLGSERPDSVTLPDWREGLAAYLAERAPAR